MHATLRAQRGESWLIRGLNQQFLVDFDVAGRSSTGVSFDGIISRNRGIKNLDNMVNAKY
ncbi:hypothetical protein UP09_01415 [Bradyrhizobium sp. LTSP885]|nr:hypothetical protein UP09_01415 [Bradyrhizobium sp. LTSP885]